MGEVVSQLNIKSKLDDLKNQGKVIVTTNGCFDILHTGHTRYLQASRAKGDVLVVLLNSDLSVKLIKGESRPINPEAERAELLCALSCVDYVVLFNESSPVELLKNIKPDIYTKGADYTLETLPEAKEILSVGTKIEFINLVVGKSTTSLIEKMCNK